jgi:hypothetical protein
VPFLFDLPDRFVRGKHPAVGSVDELHWFDAERAGLVGDDVPPGAPLYVRGWVLHVDGRRAAETVVLRIDNARNYEARVGASRPDVAAVLDLPEAKTSGFEAIIPTALLAPGPHEISVLTVDRASKTYTELATRSSFYLLSAERTLPEGVTFGEAGCEARIDEVRDVSHNREIDASAGTVDVPRGSLLFVRGWAYDIAAGRPANAIFGLIDGRTAFEAKYRLNRPDVAEHRGSAQLAPVGFSIQIPTVEFERGRHSLEIVAMAADGEHLLHSSCRLALIVRESGTRAQNITETTPAFLDSVVRVASDTNRERITPMRVGQQDQLFVRGWAIDGEAGTVGSGVLVVIDDNLEIRALYGLPRPDVAQEFANPSLLRCGFTAQVPMENLSVGRHSARCYVIAGDGRGTLSTAQQFEFEVADSLADFITHT